MAWGSTYEASMESTTMIVTASDKLGFNHLRWADQDLATMADGDDDDDDEP